MVSKESKRFCNKRVSHHLSRKKERKKEREYYATSDDANVAQHSFATLQMAKHIPQLGRVDVESGVKEKKCAFYGS